MTTRTLAIALVAMTGTARADTPPVDLVKELRATVSKIQLPEDVPAPRTDCIAITAAERAVVAKRVSAWIDASHPDETGEPLVGDDSGVHVGCKDKSGAIVLDLSQDREPVKPSPNTYRKRRNYLLKVTSAIEVIAEDTSTASIDWMEWADEGNIPLLAQIDLDGDGALDIVYSDHEHEGGAMDTIDYLHVRYASGRRANSAQITNLSEVRVVKDQLVIAGTTRNDQTFHACLGRDLRVAPCPAGDALQRAADRRAIVSRYKNLAPGDVPDRDLLVQELAMLGITGKRAAFLVAAAAKTDPGLRAERDVAAFLVKAGLVEPKPMPELVTQANPEARSYLDDLATKLGDVPCTATPLTDDEKAKALAWLKKQDEKANGIEMSASACGPYTWIAWSDSRSTDGKRREVLLRRDGTKRILGFTYEQEMGELDLAQTDRWFSRDGVIVGIVIADQHVWVVADGKVVVQSKGNVNLYRADDRWGEASVDVFIDNGTLWHATPTGREKLDLTLVRDHEARRAAIALLQNVGPTGDAKYLAALQLLGADPALVAECKKLP